MKIPWIHFRSAIPKYSALIKFHHFNDIDEVKWENFISLEGEIERRYSVI